MIIRILAVTVSLIIMCVGFVFINAGHFGAMLSGIVIFIFGGCLLVLNLIGITEQKVNNSPDWDTNPTILTMRDLAQNLVDQPLRSADPQAELMLRTAEKMGVYDDPNGPEYLPWQIAQMNTPDPHLVHPDFDKHRQNKAWTVMPNPADFYSTGGEFLSLLYVKACYDRLNPMEKASLLRSLNLDFKA